MPPILKDLKDRPKRSWGGRRAGAGIPKGTKTRPTLAKAEARELARQIITRELEPLIRAQISAALGLKCLVVRNRTNGRVVPSAKT